MGQILRFCTKKPFQVRQRFLEKLQRLVIAQIADVLAQDRV